MAMAMTRAEALALLGVGEEATADELKKAYKRKALRAHPDKGGSKEQFQRLAEAYKCLADAREGAAAAATADVDDDDWAAEIFQSVFTFNLHHMPSLIAQLYGRVELSAVELRSALEQPSLERYVLVDARSPAERGAAGAWPGPVRLTDDALEKVDVVELPTAWCVDDAGEVLFCARTGPTAEAIAMLCDDGKAALNAVAEAAHDGAHVVVLSQSGTAAGGHRRTDCQRVAFFLRNSRMLPAAADPKRVRFGFFAWRQLAPPPPEDQSDADAAVDRGAARTALRRERAARARAGRRIQAAPRDDRSSDHEPKRGDHDRDGSRNEGERGRSDAPVRRPGRVSRHLERRAGPRGRGARQPPPRGPPAGHGRPRRRGRGRRRRHRGRAEEAARPRRRAGGGLDVGEAARARAAAAEPAGPAAARGLTRARRPRLVRSPASPLARPARRAAARNLGS